MQAASPERCFSTKDSTKDPTKDPTTARTGGVIGRWWRVAFVAVVALMIGFSPSGHAYAANPTEIRARQSFAAGRYQDALDLFARLYAETLHPVYLRNIGRCHQKLREPQKAIDSFRDYLAKEKTISVEERQEIEGYVKEMQTLLDEQKQSPPAAVAPAVPVATPPPEPTEARKPAVVSAPGHAPEPVLAPAPSSAAAPSALLVQVPSATEKPSDASSSPPIYARWWFWTAIGAAAVGTVAAVFLIPGGVTRPPCVPAAMGNCR